MRTISDVVGPELAFALLAASEQKQRDVAIGVATAAIKSTGLSDPVIEEAVDGLLQENYSPGMRSAVEAIEEWLDERAWQLQSEDDAGCRDAREYHEAFKRARAAGAVKACIDGDARTALNEAVYEAAHAVDSNERFRELLEAVLDLVSAGNHWAARDLGELFWPTFIEVDGYVLLASHFSPKNLADWRRRHSDNRAAIEDVINHVHLEDVVRDQESREVIDKLGERIAAAWRATLASEFGGRAPSVEFDRSAGIVTAFTTALEADGSAPN